MSILRLAAVKAETGYKSHASVYTAMAEGLFPRQIQLSVRSVGWISDEISAVMTARAAGHTNAQIKALVTRLHAKRQELAQALV